MNQEQNNFNIQGNNVVPKNQQLNNQSFNDGVNHNVVQNPNVNQSIFNQQTINSQIQPTSSFQQSTIQVPAPQSINNDVVNLNNTIHNNVDNNKGDRKKFLSILIIIAVISLIVCGVIILSVKKNNSNSNDKILNKAQYEDKIIIYSTKYNEYFNSVIGTQDNGFVVVGRSEIDGLSSSANIKYSDGIIIKYNTNNQIEWENYYKSSSNDISDEFTDIKMLKDGGYIVSAKINGIYNRGVYYYDAALLKYNSKGNLEWIKKLEGNNVDIYNKVIVLSSGEYIAVGSSNSSNLDNVKMQGNGDAIIVKYNKKGNVIWQKNYGSEYKDSFNSVIETLDGEIIAVGVSYDKTNKEDAIIVKYDQEGNIVWQNKYSGDGNDYFYDVVLTENNEIVAVGSSSSKDIENIEFNGDTFAISIKYNNSGEYIKTYTYGTRFFNSFRTIIKYNNNYLLSGYITRDNSTDAEIVLISLDKDFNEIDKKTYGGKMDDYGYSISSMKDTGFVIVGKTHSTFENQTRLGLGDGFIMRRQNINY